MEPMESASDMQPVTRGELKTQLGLLREELASKADIRRLDERMDGLGQRMDGFDGRMDGLDQKIDKVDRKVDRVWVEVVKGWGRMDEQFERLAHEVRAGFNQVNGRIDGFLGELQTYRRETYTIPKALDKHGEQLRDHETRISRLEGNA